MAKLILYKTTLLAGTHDSDISDFETNHKSDSTSVTAALPVFTLAEKTYSEFEALVTSWSKVEYYEDEDGNYILYLRGGSFNVNIEDPLSLLGNIRVTNRHNIIELKSTYGISKLRDITTVANTGTVTNDNTEYKLKTGTTTASKATLDSAERGRYVPGSPGQVGIGVRLTNSAFTGTQDAKWGYIDNDNGFGFGKDSTGLYVFIRRAGVTSKTHQSSWNGDTLDGNGESKVTLDVSDGHIFQIDYVWYGYGAIEFSVYVNDNNKQKKIVIHRLIPTGETSVANPNLPIRAEITNGDTTSDLELFVGGRQYSVFDKYDSNYRITSELRENMSSVSSTFLPVISFRRKSDFLGTSSKLIGMDLLSDTNVIYQLRLNPSLTGESWATPGDHTASETSLEADKSATAVSGGEILYEGILNSSGSGAKSQGFVTNEPLNIDLPEQQPVTLCVRKLAGTSDATISAIMRMREQW